MIDPACGVAKFLLEASLKLSNPFYFENGKLKSRVKLVGLEKRMEDNNDDLTTILAKSNLLIYYSDLFKNNGDSPERIKLLSKEFLNTIVKSSHTTLGTLEHLVPESYDLILANPPYYQSAEITAQSKTIKLEGSDTAAYDKNGRGIEALFTEWIIKSLKKGGKANIILPDGILLILETPNSNSSFSIVVILIVSFLYLLEHSLQHQRRHIFLRYIRELIPKQENNHILYIAIYAAL